MTTISGYQTIARNLEGALSRVASRAEVKREAGYFLKHITSVSSAEEFLKDDRLYRFAMTAFGLRDMFYGKAFMKKVLNEGIDGAKAFAVQLSDPRFREFAETFNFARYGRTATAFGRAQQGTVDKYLRILLEDEAGQADEGVRLALYFKRKAPEVTSVYGLMGDAALYKVVQTALGMPAVASSAGIDKQAAFIAGKIDIASLKTGSVLDKLIARFTARWQAEHGTSAPAVPQIGLGLDPLASMDGATLLALQSIRRHS